MYTWLLLNLSISPKMPNMYRYRFHCLGSAWFHRSSQWCGAHQYSIAEYSDRPNVEAVMPNVMATCRARDFTYTIQISGRSARVRSAPITHRFSTHGKAGVFRLFIASQVAGILVVHLKADSVW